MKNQQFSPFPNRLGGDYSSYANMLACFFNYQVLRSPIQQSDLEKFDHISSFAESHADLCAEKYEVLRQSLNSMAYGQYGDDAKVRHILESALNGQRREFIESVTTYLDSKVYSPLNDPGIAKIRQASLDLALTADDGANSCGFVDFSHFCSYLNAKPLSARPYYMPQFIQPDLRFGKEFNLQKAAALKSLIFPSSDVLSSRSAANNLDLLHRKL